VYLPSRLVSPTLDAREQSFDARAVEMNDICDALNRPWNGDTVPCAIQDRDQVIRASDDKNIGLVAIKVAWQPLTGLTANFSPMPRMAPPPFGREIDGIGLAPRAGTAPLKLASRRSNPVTVPYIPSLWGVRESCPRFRVRCASGPQSRAFGSGNAIRFEA
jgi:hypothetical protein